MVIFGYLNGYVTSRFLKRFGETDIWASASLSAVALPFYIIASLFLEMIIDWFDHNTRRYRFVFLLESTICWFIVNAALCYLGAFKGYLTKSEMRIAPAGKVIRPIPPQPTYMSIYVLAPICGAIQYMAIQAEILYFIRAEMNSFKYSMFGYLFVAMILQCVIISLLSCLTTYIQLCN